MTKPEYVGEVVACTAWYAVAFAIMTTCNVGPFLFCHVVAVAG